MATMSVALTRATARSNFFAQWDAQPNMLDGMSFNVDSNSVEEIYPWILYAPPVKEKRGQTPRKPVPTVDYTIKNKRWENSVEIAYELRRFEKIGQIGQLVSMMGQKARDYPSKLLSELITDGGTNAGYDGISFFNTAHIDPGAEYQTGQSNSLTSNITTTTAPTDEEAHAAVSGAINQILSFVDGAQDPVMPPPDTVFTIMCHPGYSTVFRRLAVSDNLAIAGGGNFGNDLKGRIQVWENPWLAAPATTPAFYLINRNSIRKPFIYQTADPLELMDDAGGDYEKTTKDILFFTHAYYNLGYGDWRTMIRHTFT